MTRLTKDERLDESQVFLPAEHCPPFPQRNTTPLTDEESLESLCGLVLRFEEVELEPLTEEETSNRSEPKL